MADDSNITITLAANTAGVQTALSEAIASFQRMRQEMSYVSDASKILGDSVVQSNRSWLEAGVAAGDYQERLTYLKETLATTAAQQDESAAALRDLTASMAEQRQEMNYLADATRLLGSEQADLNMSWLLAADNANEYAARLGYLREELALTRTEQESLANDLNAGFGGIGGVGGASEGGGLGGILSSLADIPILGNATSMFTGMMGMQLFNAGYQGISNFFTQGLFGLNEQTQQNVNSWQYTYGMAPDAATADGMTPAQRVAWNNANAQKISKWSQDFSYSIPFTRQSLMTAISGAAPLGLDADGLKHYFPIFADLAATHVNPMTGQPVDLGTVVQAIRGEEMGYSRMLKYDLNINTEDLVKYGLKGQGQGAGFKITDMTTLLPALEAYSKANGWTNMVGGQDQGVAFETAHSTWWGEWSSFLDRVQNLELGSGSTLFKSMQDDLNGISNWMDNHQGSLQRVADIVGGDVAGGFKTAESAVEGLGAGLHASGFDKQLLDGLKGLEDWFSDPKHQQEVKDVAGAVGNALGNLGHGIGTAAGDFTQVWAAFQGSGIPQDVGPLAQLFYSRYFAGFGGLEGSGASFFLDLFNGDFGHSLIDLKDGMQNLSSILSFGLIPAIQDNTNGRKNNDPLKNPDPNKPSLGGIGAIVGPDAELAAIMQRIQYIEANPKDPNDNIYQQQIQALLKEYLQSIKTSDPAKLKAEQQIQNDIQTLILNPGNMLSITTALTDIQKQLDTLNGKNQGQSGSQGQSGQSGQSGSQGNFGKNPQSGAVSVNDYGPSAYQSIWNEIANTVRGAQAAAGWSAGGGPNASALMQAITGGFGGSGGGHQLGSDFVQSLATGMQTKLPIITSASQGIGTNIAQQIMQGAMQALGAGSGGAGGVSGIGPGSTLGDLVRWTVAEALHLQGGGVWSDGHTPGGFSHWGTYGF